MFSNIFNHLGGQYDNLPFRKQFRVYSVNFLSDKDRTNEDNGGKIIMPPSALDALSQKNIQYPMLFKLTNTNVGRMTHCGVLEFVAEEGRIYIPYWMMANLSISEGDFIELESTSLPVATYAKFEPQSVDFLDISDPKAVLERALRNFACLTVDDIIAIKYNQKRYEFRVLETKPGRAVSIIECDMNVEFAPPVGYEENYKREAKTPVEEEIDSAYIEPEIINTSFKAFSCSGNRLDGKSKKPEQMIVDSPEKSHKRGIPNYNYERNVIHFIRTPKPKLQEDDNEIAAFKSFQGAGNALRT